MGTADPVDMRNVQVVLLEAVIPTASGAAGGGLCLGHCVGCVRGRARAEGGGLPHALRMPPPHGPRVVNACVCRGAIEAPKAAEVWERGSMDWDDPTDAEDVGHKPHKTAALGHTFCGRIGDGEWGRGGAPP